MVESTMIGVFGASGRTGSRVLRALAERHVSTRAIGRSPATVPTSEAAFVDFNDPHTIDAKLLSGLSAVYVVVPDLPQQQLIVTQIVQAAVAAGVEHLVLHSVLHPHTRAMPHHMAHADAEDAVRSGGVAWTILQPAMYVQSVYGSLVPTDSNQTEVSHVPLPWSPETGMSPVHLDDVAEAAVTVLCEDGHHNASYELAGAEVLGLGAMVDIIAKVTGRTLEARRVDPVKFAQKISTTSAQARTWAAMFAEYGAHGLIGNPHVLRWLLGREPTRFADAIAGDIATGKT